MNSKNCRMTLVVESTTAALLCAKFGMNLDMTSSGSVTLGGMFFEMKSKRYTRPHSAQSGRARSSFERTYSVICMEPAP